MTEERFVVLVWGEQSCSYNDMFVITCSLKSALKDPRDVSLSYGLLLKVNDGSMSHKVVVENVLRDVRSPGSYCGLWHVHLCRFCNHSIWWWRHVVRWFPGEAVKPPVQGNTAAVSGDNWHGALVNVDSTCTL